jgi:hypothetical protein
MINVTIVKSPPRPVGDYPQGVNSANMFEVRVNDEYLMAFVSEAQAQIVKDGLTAGLAKLQLSNHVE